MHGLEVENTPNCSLWKPTPCRHPRGIVGLMCKYMYVLECSLPQLAATILNSRPQAFSEQDSPSRPDESSDFFPPSIILAFLSTICHYSLLHLVICVLWPDTCTQREPICVGGVSGQRRQLISDQWICRRPENRAGSHLMFVCLLVCIISHSIPGMFYMSWDD